jgi:hypothetical protein
VVEKFAASIRAEVSDRQSLDMIALDNGFLQKLLNLLRSLRLVLHEIHPAIVRIFVGKTNKISVSRRAGNWKRPYNICIHHMKRPGRLLSLSQRKACELI